MKKSQKQKGFTLMELLIVIGILAIVTASFTYIQSKSISGTYLRTSSSQIIQTIRLAQTRAATRYKDAKWGVYFAADKYVLFKGNDYVTRDQSQDDTNELHTSVSLQNFSLNGGTDYMVFQKSTGETTNYGSVQITNGSRTMNISVNSKGLIEQNEV